jgi:glycosyltransferase involved in cell wall biosynthesis
LKKLSFILPVYNVEPYIEKCIKSIKDKLMSFEEYEIIVINDGSPDNSEAIVRKLQNEIPNIILINQNNAGVSAARNRGIDVAKGQFIVFIDPDDYINPNLVQRLYDRAIKDDLDILLCGRSIVKSNGEIIHMVGYDKQKNKIYNGIDAFREKDKPFPVFDNCWGRLYKRDLVIKNKIKFPVGVVHLEDGVFIRKIFTLADRVGFENCDFYQAYERPGSASRSDIGKTRKAAIGDIKSVKDLINFKECQKLNSYQTALINESIIKYSILPLMRAINAKSLDLFLGNKRMLESEGIESLDTNYVAKNNYLKYARSFNVSIWLFASIYMYKMILKSFKSKRIKFSSQRFNNLQT